MRKILSIIVTALAIALFTSPLAAVADSCCEPASDAMASQDPLAHGGDFTTKPCAKPTSVDCYWDAIGRTGQWGHSYWSIRVGRQVCIKFWDARYDRKHGHCERRRK